MRERSATKVTSAFFSASLLCAALRCARARWLHSLFVAFFLCILLGVSPDGFDLLFVTNYLGPFYLTHLLLFCSRLARDARVVNVTSLMHRAGTIDVTDVQWRRQRVTDGRYTSAQNYCNSKLAQILFSLHFQRLLRAYGSVTRDVTTVAVHPGATSTDFIAGFVPSWLAAAAVMPPILAMLHAILLRTPSQAVQPILYAVAARQLSGVGGVYVGCTLAPETPSQDARDARLAEALYKISWQLCGIDAAAVAQLCE
jgi:NAD(P)-dependent dehydrogenase (short-subunit alcohol dehydrogenase family)